ncbi:MAG: hypothetical protein JST00_20170 [Deltaproteobacteria bacterium]|nr:hypothetical protein [Deltaproteobacteria bacterium]
MSEPNRLLDEGSDLERELLRAGKNDRPDASLERRIGAAVAAAAIGATPGVVGGSLWASSSLRLKSLTLLSVVTGLAALGYLAWRAPSDVPAARSAPVAPVVASPVITANAPANDNAAAPPTLTPDALPNARIEPATSAPAAVAAVPSAEARRAGPPPIERELALLDAAKAKLGGGDAVSALALLDTYDAEMARGGVLRQEATVLRVRSLLALGRRDEAEVLGRGLLASDPTSVHAKRVRALLGD